MKRAYRTSQYAKPCEQYCRETYPDEAASILQKAEEYYLVFLKDMPDLGKNMTAKNMLDWFTILAFYEASGHRMDGETLDHQAPGRRPDEIPRKAGGRQQAIVSVQAV